MKEPRRHIGAILLSAASVASGGCGVDVPVPIDKGEIDGKKFIMYTIRDSLYGPTERTRVEILDNTGRIEKVLGEGGSGKIGDGKTDFVEIRLADGKKVRYTIRGYTNEDGQTIPYGSDAGRIVKEVAMKKLIENDELYQRIRQVVEQNMKGRL
ncbi:hypothetical protein HYX07_05045 [Candidatus Woesearchaeota archaeon]|nr:hypothetical protein [Candidatus Woesearchaeota archaeon]